MNCAVVHTRGVIPGGGGWKMFLENQTWLLSSFYNRVSNTLFIKQTDTFQRCFDTKRGGSEMEMCVCVSGALTTRHYVKSLKSRPYIHMKAPISESATHLGRRANSA